MKQSAHTSSRTPTTEGITMRRHAFGAMAGVVRDVGAIAGAAIVIVLAGCGGDDEAVSGSPTTEPEPTAEAVTVQLAEENGSGQTGKAVLRSGDDGSLEVDLEVTPPKEEYNAPQPAHIHNVSCAEYRKIKGNPAQYETVEEALRVNGTASTFAKLDERTTGTFSINVHEPSAPYTTVACGDIPER